MHNCIHILYSECDKALLSLQDMEQLTLPSHACFHSLRHSLGSLATHSSSVTTLTVAEGDRNNVNGNNAVISVSASKSAAVISSCASVSAHSADEDKCDTAEIHQAILMTKLTIYGLYT